jgi:hypothetical protein
LHLQTIRAVNEFREEEIKEGEEPNEKTMEGFRMVDVGDGLVVPWLDYGIGKNLNDMVFQLREQVARLEKENKELKAKLSRETIVRI